MRKDIKDVEQTITQLDEQKRSLNAELLETTDAVAALRLYNEVAALTAQLTDSSRAANAMALGFLGATYLVRAIGDAGPSWLSWLSPVGWGQQVKPYAGDRWWVAVLGASAASTNARIRTLSDSFGGCLLSQEHIRVIRNQEARRDSNPPLDLHRVAC